MRKLLTRVVMAVVLVVGIAVVASQAKADTWTGWISDSGCGAKGANAEHKACAVKCVKGGASYVFVNSETKDVVAIHNQDAVKESDLGQEVKVTGTVGDDKSLNVESIEPAKGDQ